MYCKAFTKNLHFCKNKTSDRFCNIHQDFSFAEQETWFHKLPNELLELIISHFTYQEYYKLACCSKSLLYLFQPFFRNINVTKTLITRDYYLIQDIVYKYSHPFTPVCITYYHPPEARHLVFQCIYKHTLYHPIIKIHNRLENTVLYIHNPSIITDDMFELKPALKLLLQDNWTSKITIHTNYQLTDSDKKLLQNLKYPSQHGNITHLLNADRYILYDYL
jgi:hypothetical protein